MKYDIPSGYCPECKGPMIIDLFKNGYKRKCMRCNYQDEFFKFK